MEKLEKLTRLVADGRHNAFPALARHRGHLYLTYRASGGHAQSDGGVVLMRSADGGATWERLPAPLPDDRNYYEGFLVEWKGRLLMFCGAFDKDRPVLAQLSSSYVIASEDGIHWTQPVLAGEAQWRFWRPRAVEGRLYAARYRLTTRAHVDAAGVFPPEDWEVDLVVSDDGFHWSKVAELSRNESGNETELHWDGERLTAFIRRENCPATLAIRHAAPPFTEWSAPVDFGACIQGQRAMTCHGRLFLFGRYRAASPAIGTIYYDRREISFRGYLYLPQIQRFLEYIRLPGAQDCTYPDILELPDNRMLIAYYSQHEYPDSTINTPADIFLAIVRTDGEPELAPAVAARLRKEGIV
jgi:hypothetical protein